jgi:invasion protein IalB
LWSFALALLSRAAAPPLAQGDQPADKAAAPAPAEPAKVRRVETIVDDNGTVTCAQTDQAGAKRLCSAILRIAQTDKAGAERVVFTRVLGRQEGKLMSAISVPSGVQIPPGMEVKIGDKEARELGYQPDHCEALLPLEESVVKSLAAAPTTEISIRAVNGAGRHRVPATRRRWRADRGEPWAKFVADPSAIDQIVSLCHDPEFGGRVIDNIITNTILQALSREILKRSLAREEIRQAKVSSAEGASVYEVN